jgi:predicted phage terminase large subunit-like protein
MGKYPSTPVILTGYGDTIVRKHGRRARQLVSSSEYRAIFDTTLHPDTQAIDDWALTNGSGYIAKGIQSGLTGNRAHGLIWDDTIKGRLEAESFTVRENTWLAYRDDARTRKIPTAWEVGIGTRWHEDDIPGRILPDEWKGESGFIKCKDGKVWYVLCLQAQVEHEGDPLGRKIGEYLWTDWFNIDGDVEAYWAPLKLDARSWGSLYQQIPTPPEGEMFKADWVQYYTHLPADVTNYLSGDYAVTPEGEATDPDWSVIGCWAVAPDRKVYFRDGWKGRTSANVWIDQILDLTERHEPLAHITGKGQIRRAIEPYFRERMAARGVFVRPEWIEETYAKRVNLWAFQAMMAAGQVYWPRNNELAEWVIRQLIGFGTLTHDDGADMCAFLGRYLNRLWAPKVKKEQPPPPVLKPGVIPIKALGAKQLGRR